MFGAAHNHDNGNALGRIKVLFAKPKLVDIYALPA